MLADTILLVHFLIAACITLGLPAIWLGAWLNWAWVRHFWLRAAHLGGIVFVAATALAGYLCPLTVWEDALRGRSSGAGFIQRWVGTLLYWEAPTWVFTAVYVVFALLVVWTWRRVPPRR